VDDRFHEIEISAKRVHFKGNTAWLCYLKDVTTLLKTQQDLLEERALLRNVLDSIPEQIVIISENDSIISCNNVWASSNDADVKVVSGSKRSDVIDKNSIEEAPRRLIHVRKLPLYNSETKNLETSNLETKNPEKNIFGVLSIDSDITDMHDLSEQLEKENRLGVTASKQLSHQVSVLKNVVKSNQEAMGLITLQGKIITLNTPFSELLLTHSINIEGQLISELDAQQTSWISEKNNQLSETNTELVFEKTILITVQLLDFQVVEKSPETVEAIKYSLNPKEDLETTGPNIVDALKDISDRRVFELYFNTFWQHAVDEDEMVSLIICDIDCLQAYNTLWAK